MQYTLRALPQGALSKLSGGYSSVGRAPDCDSGCRGFEPRFSPHFLLGFQPKKKLKSPIL